MQAAGMAGNSTQEPTASTLSMQSTVLAMLIGLLRDLALCEAHSARRLGFQVVLPALCSLLGPSLHHEQLASQMTGIFEAAAQSSSTGAHHARLTAVGQLPYSNQYLRQSTPERKDFWGTY